MEFLVSIQSYDLIVLYRTLSDADQATLDVAETMGEIIYSSDGRPFSTARPFHLGRKGSDSADLPATSFGGAVIPDFTIVGTWAILDNNLQPTSYSIEFRTDGSAIFYDDRIEQEPDGTDLFSEYSFDSETQIMVVALQSHKTWFIYYQHEDMIIAYNDCLDDWMSQQGVIEKDAEGMVVYSLTGRAFDKQDFRYLLRESA